MRTMIVTTVIATGLGLSLASCSMQASTANAPTESALDFALESVDPDVEPFRFAEARGHYVALHFLLETACPRCANYTRDYLTAEPDPQVVHVFIKPDAKPQIKRWLRKYYKPEYPDPVIYRDPNAQLAKRLEIPFGYKFHKTVVHFPALVLFDKNGQEIYRHIGRNTADRCTPSCLAAQLAKHRDR